MIGFICRKQVIVGRADFGRCYADGLGVEKDMKRAQMFYEKGCESEDNRGYFDLGFTYDDRKSLASDQRQMQVEPTEGPGTVDMPMDVSILACCASLVMV
jgi:TPR repeat protein